MELTSGLFRPPGCAGWAGPQAGVLGCGNAGPWCPIAVQLDTGGVKKCLLEKVGVLKNVGLLKMLLKNDGMLKNVS